MGFRIPAGVAALALAMSSVLGSAASPPAASVGVASAAQADPSVWGVISNLTRQLQRAKVYSTPAYQERLRAESQIAFRTALETLRDDPERNFVTDLCWSKALVLSPCLGDIRLYDWEANGYGVVEPVLFTNRSGATISGHVWATRSGPARRPGIVITSGAIQSSEQMYWWAAQVLAKAGYVVLTTDPQNQGMSDTLGDGADRLDGALSQVTFQTYYDGTQDSLDFLLSTPASSYCPRSSRAGHDHCGKQRRRVAEGFNADHNPFWRRVDRARIGLAGHSAGAVGVSYMGQLDPRVGAVVAWDNLCLPAECALRPPGPAPTARVPALGISQDFLTPDPLAGSVGSASKELSRIGIDSGQLFIRGGTHYEYSFVPMVAFPATLRGIDLAAWYTTAWFDKYLRRDRTADARLLTTRWRADSADRRVDPANRGNLHSFLHPSRLDVRLADGSRFRCEDLRRGCAGQSVDDGGAAGYSYLDLATTPDR